MKNKILMAVLALFVAQTAFAQEADDMYFFTSDRKEVKQKVSKSDKNISDESLELPNFDNPNGTILIDSADFNGEYVHTYNPHNQNLNNFNNGFRNDFAGRNNWQVNNIYVVNTFGNPYGFYGADPFFRGNAFYRPIGFRNAGFYDPFFYDPFWNSGFNSGIAVNRGFGSNVFVGVGFGNSWGINRGFYGGGFGNSFGVNRGFYGGGVGNVGAGGYYCPPGGGFAGGGN